jgi:hypothetical protein
LTSIWGVPDEEGPEPEGGSRLEEVGKRGVDLEAVVGVVTDDTAGEVVVLEVETLDEDDEDDEDDEGVDIGSK